MNFSQCISQLYVLSHPTWDNFNFSIYAADDSWKWYGTPIMCWYKSVCIMFSSTHNRYSPSTMYMLWCKWVFMWCSMDIDVNVGVECRFVVHLHTPLNHYMIHRHREAAYQVWYKTTTHYLFFYIWLLYSLVL